MQIERQQHAYDNGHQLAASTMVLDKRDQEIVNRLSDVSGPLGPGERFEPYLTGYPLPSGRYVLARTWLDEFARRAGCVRTESLVLIGSEWATLQSPSALIPLLDGFSGSLRAPLDPDSNPTRGPLPPLVSAATTELVEALFLEAKQPVVCFEAQSPELIMARLLEALGPSFRQQIAFCTYALQPRSVDGRPFDLLFAPKSARSRFSTWPGRKLDASPRNANPARHPWSSRLADAIFLNPNPSLEDFDSLGLLSAPDADTSTALRLSMLWRDLEMKVGRDPSAIPAMLDVLKAASVSKTEKARLAQHILDFAVAAVDQPSTNEQATNLIRLLVAKLPPIASTPAINSKLAGLCELAVAKSPGSCVSILEAAEQANIAEPLLPALARGLYSSTRKAAVAEVLLSAPSTDLAALLSANSSLLQRAVSASGKSDQMLEHLEAALWAANERQRHAIVGWLPAQIDCSVHARFLYPLLENLTESEVAGVLTSLLRPRNALLIPEVKAAVEAVLIPIHSKSVRQAITSTQWSAELDDLVTATLQANSADFEWLTSEFDVAEPRRTSMIVSYLGSLTDLELAAVVKDSNVNLAQVIRALIEIDGVRPLQEAARLLPYSLGAVAVLGPALPRMFEALPRDSARRFLAGVAPSVRDNLPIGKLTIWRDFLALPTVVELLEASSHQTRVDLLVPDGMSQQDPKRQAALLAISAELRKDHPIRKSLIRNAGLVTARLILMSPQAFDEPAVNAWASLLRESNDGRASETAFAYVMRHPSRQMAQLAFATFPGVLSVAEAPSSPLDYWARMMGLDFDNAKDVRDRLVQAYMTAGWPLSDLLVGASIAGAEDKVVKLIERLPHGVSMLAEAANALTRRKDVKSRVLKRLLHMLGKD